MRNLQIIRSSDNHDRNAQRENSLREEAPGVDRRHEPRIAAELAVTVWGIDTRGERFLQNAVVQNISLSGALLCGLKAEVRSGDEIGILYSGNKARYRVIWIRHTSMELHAAVHRIDPDECPWKKLIVDPLVEP